MYDHVVRVWGSQAVPKARCGGTHVIRVCFRPLTSYIAPWPTNQEQHPHPNLQGKHENM
jgi:hypothetical protein